MKELRLGHPVICENCEHGTKGVYICQDDDGGHAVLFGNIVAWCDNFNVKLDLSGTPINGDEVEYSNHPEYIESEKGLYIGSAGAMRHIIRDVQGTVKTVMYARYSQQSKRDKVRALIKDVSIQKGIFVYSELADQIDKIYQEDK